MVESNFIVIFIKNLMGEYMRRVGKYPTNLHLTGSEYKAAFIYYNDRVPNYDELSFLAGTTYGDVTIKLTEESWEGL